VFRICDKQLLSSFLYQVILQSSAFIKLNVSGKADVEYSTCTELTAFAKLIRECNSPKVFYFLMKLSTSGFCC